MVKKLMKLSSAPVIPLGASSMLAIAAGIVAVVGVSSLHKRRAERASAAATSSGGASKATQVAVGLLSVHVPQNFRYVSTDKLAAYMHIYWCGRLTDGLCHVRCAGTW